MFNEYLINNILKNKVYFGDSGISKDMISFVYAANNKGDRVVFDILKQVNQIRKVFLLLKGLKKRKKPILFFGLNQSGIDSQTEVVVSSVNKQIFKLCFSILNTEKQDLINNKIENFYDSVYIKQSDYKNFNVESSFVDFENFIKLLVKNKEIKVNGCFFNSWGEGSISNYHYLIAALNSGDKKILDNFFFNGRFQNLKNLSSVLDNSKNFPGAVVFFSRSGYDYFFHEFKKLGIPVICIVNSNESIKDINFPLLGDNSLLNTIYFYQKIIEFALKSD